MAGKPKAMLLLLVSSLVWISVALCAYACLMLYKADSPVAAGRVSYLWPPACSLLKARDRFTLIMFIHPKCPCSSASLTELSRLVTRCNEKAKVYAVFFQPEKGPDDWCRTRHWVRACGIPWTTVIADRGGAIAKLFNAHTSGEAFVYDAKGNLVFSGGITGARGHEGDNQGLDSVVAIVRDGTSSCPRTKAFGCGLYQHNSGISK